MGIEIDQTTLTFTPDTTPGQAAYEQFCEDVVALPPWGKVSESRKLTWERAAQAAINKHQETCCCDCTS